MNKEFEAEVQAVEPFIVQGDILSFKAIPCMQYDTEIVAYIENIQYHEKAKVRKGRTEFEPDTAYLAKWYVIDATILDKELTEKGDKVRFNLHPATAKGLIDDAQEMRSRLMKAVFLAEKKDYQIENENGTFSQKTAIYPRLSNYCFFDCFDSKKAEKVIKGGK